MYKITAFFITFIQLFTLIFSGAAGMELRDCNSAELPVAERCEKRAELLATSYYNNCYITAAHKLTLTLGQNGSTASCWEYGGLLSLSAKMAALDGKYIKTVNRVIDDLQYYRHVNSDGSFGGYAVARAAIKNRANEKIAYDDNMWLCRDFIYLYELTGNGVYLGYAREIADYLIENAYDTIEREILTSYGFDIPADTQVGGFYWDYRHDAMHTCSNGPAVQILAALARHTDNADYLRYAESTYAFLKCLENEDGVFYDLMALEKDENNGITGVMGLSREYYTYNSGSPVTGAVELYKATNDSFYLTEAKHWAASADRFFAKDIGNGVKSYPGNRSWFHLILLGGFCALAPYDESCDEYIDNMLGSIDLAYDNYRYERDELFGGTFIPPMWTDGFSDDWSSDFNTINLSANAEIYAVLAAYYAA